MYFEESENSDEKNPDLLSFRSYFHEISDEEIEDAIDYLASSIPENLLKEAFDLFQQDIKLISMSHFNVGIYVRNLLRKGGFDFGDIELDENWEYLLWRASKKVCGKKG